MLTEKMQEYLLEVGRILGAYLLSVEQKEKINGLLLEANEAKEKFKDQSEVVDKINTELKDRQDVLESNSKELNNLNMTLEEEIQEKNILEEELRSLNEELEVTVYERTTRLQESNIELRYTNAILEEKIQEKNETQNELRESEQRFRLAIQDSPVPIMLHAEDGEVLAISNAWTEMTGYAIEDIPTTDIWAFKAYGEKNINIKKIIESLFELGERQYDGEFDVKTIDGDTRTWGFYSTPIGKIPDKRRIVMSVAVDVTEQKQFEKDLLIAMEKAKESAVLKSKFLANMSHEIRTPMNGIIGMLEVLNMTELKKEQIDYLDMIKSSSKSLLHILNDILDYSKMEAGKIEIQNKKFNLREVIVRVASMFSPLLYDKELRLESKITETVPEYLIGDEDRLQQILVNLVGNALKFTEKGEIAIEASVINQNIEYSTIEFAVSDTGIGIKESDLTMVFERFNQVDEKGNNKKNGTGLGLAISKGLVEMMNGSIKVESEYNVGSKFSFELSLKHSEEEYAPSTVQKHEGVKVLKQSKILIVEDDYISSKMLKMLLEKNGYKSILAKSGEEALRLFKKGGLELVLMDINLPGISGFEATQKMKQHDNLHGKSTPIIAMTANALNGDKEKCIESGMDDYLTKPIELEEFFEKIRKYY